MVDNEGVAQALLEGVRTTADVATWIGQRLMEVERFVGQLPSVAIFVPTEQEVKPLADALKSAPSLIRTFTWLRA
jgi:hypothetical protein